SLSLSLSLSGIMKPGLNAIMGATGSGKSSFLDVLAARKDPVGLTGEILIDGAPQPPNFKCLSGYVVQDDVVMGTLTVRENFSFSAALRLPTSVSQQEKDTRVEQLIQQLGLVKVADSKVGTQLIRGVSGGERKRTNIGMELIINPGVLFLDEPTTGLDASTANSVLLLLKRMSDHGRTIILSIHQPRYSIYRLFDSLTLLVNGKQVFHGPAQNALGYFSDIGYTCEPHNNPADFFLDVINGDSSALKDNEEVDSGEGSSRKVEEKLVEEYRSSSYFKDTKAELGTYKVDERITQGKEVSTAPVARTITYTTGFGTQFRWVLKRTFKNLLFGALFFITINQCFSSLSAAELFITERKIFMHEYTSGYYRLSVYFLCKILSDILTLRTVPAIVFSCVAYFMIGLKATVAAFFTFMLSVALTAYTATSMTMAISADQTVVAIANIFMTITFVFMMIFTGLLVNLTSIPVWLAWLRYFSIPRYGLSALLVNEFRGLTFCNSTASPAQICTGEAFLAYQGVDASDWGLWQNHMALGIMTCIFLSIAYTKLRFIKKFT
uniref:Broad substrate specificity ATP-binding cassette transporter ABCG2 n=1 Tax=Gadus morhua TaxID=8049 RepID=A0A8C5BDK7_GADMO